MTFIFIVCLSDNNYFLVVICQDLWEILNNPRRIGALLLYSTACFSLEHSLHKMLKCSITARRLADQQSANQTLLESSELLALLLLCPSGP